MKKSNLIFLGLEIFILGLGGLFIFILYQHTLIENYNDKDRFFDEFTGCNNLGLEETVDCFQDFTNQYFFYNLTNDNINLTNNEFRSRGGDCFDYSKFFKREGEKRGFNATIEAIDTIPGDGEQHVYVIFWNWEGYCWIDIYKHTCIIFNSEKPNEPIKEKLTYIQGLEGVNKFNS